MKKFKFTLEKVKDQRQIQVELAQKDFAEAQMIWQQEFDKLNEIITTKENTIQERRQIIAQTTDWSAEVESMNVFLIGQDLRIKNQNLRLKEAEKLVEAKREILRQAVSEVKILERLEETQKQKHRQEALRLEQAELDEIATQRFSRIEDLAKDSHDDGL